MTYEEIIEKVAESTGYSKQFVNKVYKAYWKAIREYITSLPLKEDLTEEEFSKLKPNVNIPSIGKLNVTWAKYQRVKKQYQIIQSKIKNAKD